MQTIGTFNRERDNMDIVSGLHEEKKKKKLKKLFGNLGKKHCFQKIVHATQ